MYDRAASGAILADERLLAHGAFARALLPVLENLQWAVVVARKRGDTDAPAQGITLVQSRLLEIFGRFGVTRRGARGRPSDPDLDEVVLQEPRDDVARAL